MLPSLASAAPVPVQIDGRDLLVSPLSDRDFDELSLWYQGRVLRIARASLDPESAPAEREETLHAAYSHAAKIDFFSEFRSGGLMAQKEVMAQFVWRTLRKRQPALTLDEARRLAESDASVDIVDAWHLAQFGKPTKEEGPGKNEQTGPTVPAP